VYIKDDTKGPEMGFEDLEAAEAIGAEAATTKVEREATDAKIGAEA